MRLHGQFLIALAAGVGFDLAAASPCLAQAWLPPKGEAWFSFSYANLYVNRHYFSKGEAVGGSQLQSNTYLAHVGYSITNRLGVAAALPYADAKYLGGTPHLYPVDDGNRHGTFTDFQVEARYNVFNGPAALTPFVGAILPSHHYEYFGHAVVGLDLRQFVVGTGFGFRLDSIVPNAYLVGRYSFAFIEKVQNISRNRSNLEVQLGYNLTPALQIFALGTGQYTHGGLDLDPPVVRATWTAEMIHHHTQTGRSQLLGVGGGVAYQLAPNIDVQAGYLTTVAGRNDHAVHSLVVLGFTVGFSPRQVVRSLSHKEPAPQRAPGF